MNISLLIRRHNNNNNRKKTHRRIFLSVVWSTCWCLLCLCRWLRIPNSPKLSPWRWASPAVWRWLHAEDYPHNPLSYCREMRLAFHDRQGQSDHFLHSALCSLFSYRLFCSTNNNLTQSLPLFIIVLLKLHWKTSHCRLFVGFTCFLPKSKVTDANWDDTTIVRLQEQHLYNWACATPWKVINCVRCSTKINTDACHVWVSNSHITSLSLGCAWK